jgi:hypothetical protein
MEHWFVKVRCSTPSSRSRAVFEVAVGYWRDSQSFRFNILITSEAWDSGWENVSAGLVMVAVRKKSVAIRKSDAPVATKTLEHFDSGEGAAAQLP